MQRHCVIHHLFCIFVTIGFVFKLALSESTTTLGTSWTALDDATIANNIVSSSTTDDGTTSEPSAPSNTTNIEESTPATSDNSTTPVNPSTLVPTHATVSKWEINTTEGYPCMMVQFKGYISFRKSYGIWWTVEIPDIATSNRSTCSGRLSTFWLEFLAPTVEYNMFGLELTFLSYKESPRVYRLRKITTYLNSEATATLTENHLEEDFFVVPMGYYYTCKNITLIPGFDFNITLIEPKLQPFVNNTATGNFGDAYVCQGPPTHSPLPPTSPGDEVKKNVGAIVGGTIVVLVVVAAISIVVVMKISKNRSVSGHHVLINEDE